MIEAGLEPPEAIYLDGKLHRFNSGTKGAPGHSKPGWYVAFGDGVPAGRFGCWRAGIEQAWQAEMGRKLTIAEELAHTRRMGEAKAAREAEQERSQAVAASTVDAIWTAGGAASADHPYLARKGIAPNGARITGDGRLMVPLYGAEGDLASVQYIAADGEKRYHSGGATGGKFWMLGEPSATIYIAEGFATAATIHQATGKACAVAYSASNLVPVTGALRERFGAQQDLVIVADNDASGVGQRYAEQASAKYGARSVMPPAAGDANDYVQAGNDLAALLEPAVSDWLMPADEFSRQPAPIKWMVKGWIQQAALIMVHGPSGGGKTFATLDWCLRMAQGQQDWFGRRVTPGAIVYLAGEGHHGLRSRIAAWKERHGNGQPLNMYLSKSGCDLDTPEGYRKVSEHIRALPIKPAIITIDTLHRFNSGDENSSQDAKAMLDACAMLMAEFNCTIILVHHTGVSEETQHRARGSSAWRGALDIEISIVPAKGDAPMEIIQRKSKDAELAPTLYATLEKVIIPGWFDEDGEPVTSAVLVQAGEPTKAVRVKLRSPNANDGLEAFKVLSLECVGHEEWRASFYAMSELSSTNSKKQAFARVVSELLDREEILQTEPGVYELKIDLP
jgi:phage/plasmid primase-like uncharacterized protein